MISEFEANLVCKASFRTARASQRNPASKNPRGGDKNKISNNNKPGLKLPRLVLTFQSLCLSLPSSTGHHA